MSSRRDFKQVQIGEHLIGEDCRPFVVAEMSGNHNGDLSRALAIVDAIADSGAQAVKLQTYRADTITIDVDEPAFRISDSHELWSGANLYGLYDKAHTPWEWHQPIFERARERGLVAFSSPFDASAVDLLVDLDAPAFKIASLEIGDLPLIRRVAQVGRPVILSTGAANVADIDRAVRMIRAEGNDQIVVLGCTSSYPASPAETNLRTIPAIRDVWRVVAGLSDHTAGIGVAVAAVALGAAMVEKHVTLARADGGVDADFSLEPAELRLLVDETQRAWQALGEVRFEPTQGESESLRLRRSLYVVKDVAAGELVTSENVRSIRPAGGLEPIMMDTVVGRVFRRDARKGTPLTWDIV
ncbi:MAG: pseudaminic acid synthase [Propionibacteriaceae bacterium]|nr:pseudaminic acid synthase [Propionibacteriaceae bacterium]